jgi:hypothetical protein
VTKQKYIITNVVYGDLYAKIFLEHHLRSVLDDTNLPALKDKYDVDYYIYTDAETEPQLQAHPNFRRLLATCNVKVAKFEFSQQHERNKFGARYSVLMQVFHESVKMALEQNALLTAWVADLVVARDFFTKCLDKIEKGHGAVFVLPLRSAFETTAPQLAQMNRAQEAKDLFEIGFQNLHPLWVACEWENRRFTKLPFSMLWSTRTGIMARSFSITPILFKPTQEMLEGRGMIDGEIPGQCINPYWAENWTDAPVIGVEPLFCYYPTFSNVPAVRKGVRLWSKTCIHPSQIPLAKRPLYYPDKSTARVSAWLKFKSDRVIGAITK